MRASCPAPETRIPAGSCRASAANRARVGRLVDEQSPRLAVAAWCRAEVREVEREDPSTFGLGDCHHGGIDEPEPECGVTAIDLEGPPEHGIGQRRPAVHPIDEVVEERTRGIGASTRAHEPVGLDDDGVRDQEIAADAGHERRCQMVRLVTTVDRREQRTRIDDYRGCLSSEASASST